MSGELIIIIMLASLVLLLFLGLPVAFSLGGLAMLFTFLLWGPQSLYVGASAVWGTGQDWLLVCVPLFIFMADVLQVSGVADDLYTMMHRWMGPLRGGLAMGTVVICTVFAAMAGISGAATVTMGEVSLPAMLKRKYHKSIALGCISAGGALGILIPPSLIMILYGAMTRVSVGKLFIAGIFPGLLLSAMFIIYIGIRCIIKPQEGPPLPVEERSDWRLKLVSLRAVILPLLIVVGVLGSIYTGAATPTEAAGVGALGAIIAALVYRRLNWGNLKDACYRSYTLVVMVLWCVIGATCFRFMYVAAGGSEFVKATLLALPVGSYGILIGIQLIIFAMGMFLDPVGIVMIATPIFMPVIEALGFDPLWFGILFVMNLEMSYLTPPVGFNLFYLKGVCPPEITMGDIYRSVIPFVILQALGLATVIILPQIALWLPGMMMK